MRLAGGFPVRAAVGGPPPSEWSHVGRSVRQGRQHRRSRVEYRGGPTCIVAAEAKRGRPQSPRVENDRGCRPDRSPGERGCQLRVYPRKGHRSKTGRELRCPCGPTNSSLRQPLVCQPITRPPSHSHARKATLTGPSGRVEPKALRRCVWQPVARSCRGIGPTVQRKASRGPPCDTQHAPFAVAIHHGRGNICWLQKAHKLRFRHPCWYAAIGAPTPGWKRQRPTPTRRGCFVYRSQLVEFLL